MCFHIWLPLNKLESNAGTHFSDPSRFSIASNSATGALSALYLSDTHLAYPSLAIWLLVHCPLSTLLRSASRFSIASHLAFPSLPIRLQVRCLLSTTL